MKRFAVAIVAVGIAAQQPAFGGEQVGRYNEVTNVTTVMSEYLRVSDLRVPRKGDLLWEVFAIGSFEGRSGRARTATLYFRALSSEWILRGGRPALTLLQDGKRIALGKLEFDEAKVHDSGILTEDFRISVSSRTLLSMCRAESVLASVGGLPPIAIDQKAQYQLLKFARDIGWARQADVDAAHERLLDATDTATQSPVR